MLDALSRFVAVNARFILFITVALAAAGVWTARGLETSVFPRTDFPRVVVLVDAGVMPIDQMMATVTRPLEEAMNGIPGVARITSTTGRGTAEVNVFFGWGTNMVESLFYVQGRLARLSAELPARADIQTWRVTFSAFPVFGVSLTGQDRDAAELWETARYLVQPRLQRIHGVARVDLVGGREPEVHVIADPARLAAVGLTLTDLVERLKATNAIASAGLLEEHHQLELALVSGRFANDEEIGGVVVALTPQKTPIFLRDVARVERGQAPSFKRVTARGRDSVLLDVRMQPEASTLAVADAVRAELEAVRRELGPGMELTPYYDQSLLVRASVRSVWESIGFGLILSVLILVFFLHDVRIAAVALVIIPVTLLVTIVAMPPLGLGFNLMTLGGIAAAIGLVIDDAIVVIEDIHKKRAEGRSPDEAITEAIRDIGVPLIGSTLTPVVVFIPLAFLEGVAGVFFRSLALTMTVALLTSLVLALTLTPTLARRLAAHGPRREEGRLMALASRIYERAVRTGLRFPWLTFTASALVLGATLGLYRMAKTDFLPEQDEGAFVLDYWMPPGTSLSETNRVLTAVEILIAQTPEVETYSRRTGTELGFAVTEPNRGDMLVKLRPTRERETEAVVDDLRKKIHDSAPMLKIEFVGILNDLIGDLQWSPAPIEVKVFSADPEVVRAKAVEIAHVLETVPGVVDVFDGVVVAGPAVTLKVDPVASARAGLKVEQAASLAETALLGEVATTMLKGDRPVPVRVRADIDLGLGVSALRRLVVRTPGGALVALADLGRLEREEGQMELRREDLRQSVAVEARLSGRDLGSAIAEIQRKVSATVRLPPGATIEYGGAWQQQQEAFTRLLLVLAMAVGLVFAVLLAEFGAFAPALAIVWGALLSLFGAFAALLLTGTTFNIVSFLGAIIGVGIVAKNGILLLDHVGNLEASGMELGEALVQSGRRRLRPVLMTSLAAALGMLPLALGIGTGGEMLRPLAIAVMGGLAISVALSLVATPVAYRLLRRG